GIIDGLTAAHRLVILDELLDLLLIIRSDGPWIGDHARLVFEIFELRELREGEGDFVMIQQMEHQHLMLLITQMPQALHDLWGLIEQIRQQDDKATSLELAGDVMQRAAEVGIPARPR